MILIYSGFVTLIMQQQYGTLWHVILCREYDNNDISIDTEVILIITVMIIFIIVPITSNNEKCYFKDEYDRVITG